MGETRQYVLVDTVTVDKFKVYQYCRYTCACWRAIGEAKSKTNSMYSVGSYHTVVTASTVQVGRGYRENKYVYIYYSGLVHQ